MTKEQAIFELLDYSMVRLSSLIAQKTICFMGDMMYQVFQPTVFNEVYKSIWLNYVRMN